jgi:hypothetical protein
MAELKNMTVQALRELARKALGRGHSKLKTKGELIAALQAAGRNVSGAAGKAAARVKEATGRAAKAAEKVVDTARSRAKASRAAKAAEKVVDTARSRAKASRAAKAARAKSAAKARPKSRKEKAKELGETMPPGVAERRLDPRRDEPDADGYFVARIAGEEAVQRSPHPMTESALEEQNAAAPEPPRPRQRHDEERLGELPWTYGDDTFVALPRDPKTLFVYWDHHAETLRNGFEALDGGARPQLWVFGRNAAGGWDRVRVVEFAIESRGYYVHDLEPGRVYRAEIHLVDRAGQDKLLSTSSNEMMLPPLGPSPIVDDKFMRIPWNEPLQRLLRHVRDGAPFPEELRALLAELSDWSRFVGPTWGSGSAGGPGGRPTGAPTSPSSPSSPFGPWGSGSEEGQ